jgi:hypothetical protein
MVNHDQLFKKLLMTFFVDFIETFLPDLAGILDKSFVVAPLDKELFSDLTSGQAHEADLVVKAKLKNVDSYFAIHVEAQAHRQTNFSQRMFHYFARLHEKYAMPVYPIVIFSFEKPLRQQPSSYKVSFPRFPVLSFHFQAIQLNRLDWRKYIRNPNPVAVALMMKMQIAPEDYRRVTLECLDLFVSLKLKPSHYRLISDQ